MISHAGWNCIMKHSSSFRSRCTIRLRKARSIINKMSHHMNDSKISFKFEFCFDGRPTLLFLGLVSLQWYVVIVLRHFDSCCWWCFVYNREMSNIAYCNVFIMQIWPPQIVAFLIFLHKRIDKIDTRPAHSAIHLRIVHANVFYI